MPDFTWNDLAVAIGQPVYDNRRRLLRALTWKVLSHWTTDQRIDEVFFNSPLVGNLSHQVQPRRSRSGLRDLLSVETMICMCAMECNGQGDDGIGLVFAAVLNPSGNSMPSGKARTGYDFGRHMDFNDERVKTWAGIVTNKTKSTAPTTNPKPKGTSVNAPVRTKPARTHHINELPLNGLVSMVQRIRLLVPATDVDEIMEAIDALCSSMALADAGLPKMLRQIANTTKFLDPKSRDWGLPEGEPMERLQQDIVDYICNPAVALPVHTTSVAITAQIKALEDQLAIALNALVDAETERDGARDAAGMLSDEVDRLRGELKALRKASVHVDLLPEGKVVLEPAAKVFQIEGAGASMFNFRVPTWKWEDEPDEVPVVDPNYIFRPMDLFKTLMTIVTDQRMWLKGHTGTGKTTLVEQVAARLKWPVLRINFDSEITRLDLIGRDVLRVENGQTVSMFADGLLPKGLAGPYILLLDEFDRIRPDIAYVMQRALEGNGLTVVEDGGRHIVPHQWSRTIATANTAGQGDDTGLYPGARPQSAALLDRFTSWADIDYLSPPERKKLIQAHVPHLDNGLLGPLLIYIDEHLTAFVKAQVFQPLTPRTYLSLASALHLWTKQMPGMRNTAVLHAFGQTVLDRCTPQDLLVLKGLVQRTFSV